MPNHNASSKPAILHGRIAVSGEAFAEVPIDVRRDAQRLILDIPIPDAAGESKETFRMVRLTLEIGELSLEDSRDDPSGRKDARSLLRAYGVESSPARLDEMVIAAIERMQRLARRSEPRKAFSDAEKQALIEGGFDLEPDLEGRDPVAETAADYAALLKTALTTAQAAERLGVDPSRIRQRLTEAPPTLFGIRVGNVWRLPRFQFDARGLVPGFDRVAAGLPVGVHPLSVYRWFTTPDPDLPADQDEEDCLSPRDWLRQGRPIGPVVEHASNL